MEEQIKSCKTCQENKPINEFTQDSKTGKFGIVCKKCRNEKYKGRYSSFAKVKYQLNKDFYKKQSIEYRKKNPEKCKKLNKKNKKKLVSRIQRHLSRRVSEWFLQRGLIRPDTYKAPSTKKLQDFLNQNFREGMTPENYGEWTIDHIKPFCMFNLFDEKDLLAANSISNLQLLWRKENEKKGISYDPDHPMGWKGLDAILSEEDKKLISERTGYVFGPPIL